MQKLTRNAIRCRHCNVILESTHRHDFRRCQCGRVFVDGGLDYTRRGFKEPGDYVELSEWEDGGEPDPIVEPETTDLDLDKLVAAFRLAIANGERE